MTDFDGVKTKWLNEFLEDLPQLSIASRRKIEAPIKLSELEFVLKEAATNKSPGIDGLPYELNNPPVLSFATFGT